MRSRCALHHPIYFSTHFIPTKTQFSQKIYFHFPTLPYQRVELICGTHLTMIFLYIDSNNTYPEIIYGTNYLHNITIKFNDLEDK